VVRPASWRSAMSTRPWPAVTPRAPGLMPHGVPETVIAGRGTGLGIAVGPRTVTTRHALPKRRPVSRRLVHRAHLLQSGLAGGLQRAPRVAITPREVPGDGRRPCSTWYAGTSLRPGAVSPRRYMAGG
jgi:hypothetical protein